jgi:hypothetical protein
MILHIVLDEKFTDPAFQIFEAVNPGKNLYLKAGGKKNRYIKETPVQSVPYSYFFRKKFARSLESYDMVILHSLHISNLFLVANLPEKIKVVWIGWGFDYYDLISNGDMNALYLPLTKNLSDNNAKKISGLIKKIESTFLSIILKNLKHNVVNRIDYFSPVLYEDYVLVKNAIPDFKPKYIPWNNGTLEYLIKGYENVTLSGNDILVGNNASYENNHLDVFDILLKIKLENRKIVSPLSYGDPVYRDCIISSGKRNWGENFLPIVDYMPLDEYIQKISSCSIIIIDSLRQLAMGNIIIMMYLGGKVFLNKKNPVYHYFKQKGAFIYTIEELENEINNPLSENQIKVNQNILKMDWAKEVILEKTQKLIDCAMD